MNPPKFDHTALDRLLKEKVGTSEKQLEKFATRVGISKRTLDNYRKGDVPEAINVLAALHFWLILEFDSPLFKEPEN